MSAGSNSAEAPLVLDATVVTGNASEGGQMSAGGGIASGTLQNGPAGTLVLNASQVTRNSTSGDAGGILNHAGTAVLNSSKVTFNTAGNGGGIASGPGNGGDPHGSSPDPEGQHSGAQLGHRGRRRACWGGHRQWRPGGDQVQLDHGQRAPGGIGAPSSAGTVILRATTVTRNAPDNCEPAGTIRGCTG